MAGRQQQPRNYLISLKKTKQNPDAPAAMTVCNVLYTTVNHRGDLMCIDFAKDTYGHNTNCFAVFAAGSWISAIPVDAPVPAEAGVA